MDGSPVNESECRIVVRQRSGGSCERCDQYRGESMHHRVKRSHGGEWTPANIVHVCGTGGGVGCHGWIEDNAISAGIEGWALITGTDPETVPVRLPIYPGIPCHLLDDGTIRFGEGTMEPRELVTTGHSVPARLRHIDAWDMAEDAKRARQEYIDSHGPARGERP